LNEEANVAQAITEVWEQLSRHFERLSIVVVDDGSTDGTAAVVRSLRPGAPGPLCLIQHGYNRGYGAALKTGVAAAEGNLLTFVMADGQFNAACVEQLIPYIDSWDLVLGTRARREDRWIRRFNSRLYVALANRLFHLGVQDVNCGKLFHTTVLRQMPLLSTGPVIDTEILTRARQRGYRWIEVPVPHFPRRAGRAKGSSPLNVLWSLVDLWSLRQRLRG
jgi:glycosyltransferase involved in cell wall biosynthesis